MKKGETIIYNIMPAIILVLMLCIAVIPVEAKSKCTHEEQCAVYNQKLFGTNKHKVTVKCLACGKTLKTYTQKHTKGDPVYSGITAKKHTETVYCCDCGRKLSKTKSSHKYNKKGVCKCGRRKEKK